MEEGINTLKIIKMIERSVFAGVPRNSLSYEQILEARTLVGETQRLRLKIEALSYLTDTLDHRKVQILQLN